MSYTDLDETTLQVLDEPGRPAQSKSYLWLMASFGRLLAMVFQYSPSRSQDTPNQLLTPTTQAIAYIQKLYRIETKTKDDPPARRYEIRQREAVPIIDNRKMVG